MFKNSYIKKFFAECETELAEAELEKGNSRKTKINGLKKRVQNKTNKLVKILQEIDNAELPRTIDIKVDWVKNSTWGLNPHCRVYAGEESTIYKVSGCGYDKLSASIAGALSEIKSLKKLLIKARFNKKINDTWGDGLSLYREKKGIFPRFEASGERCLREGLEVLGYKLLESSSGKYHDYYYFELKK